MTEAPAKCSLGRPIDEAEWPSQLTARVVSPGAQPTLHGYDVETDLATHYSFAETILLSLTGEPPTKGHGRAFEILLQFSAPSPVNEAPTHAAVLARICVGTTSSILGTAAVGLAEQARVVAESHRSWIAALANPVAALPPEFRATSDEERLSVERLRHALREHLRVPALEHDVSRTAAVLAGLYECGLHGADQLESALVLARMPTALAEALATPPGSYRHYPVLLPPIAYDEGVT